MNTATPTTTIKNKIYRSLEEMGAVHLQSAYQILKGFVNQQKYGDFKVQQDLVERKIEEGIKQLDNGEGSDFGLFLNELNSKYGGKK